MSMLEEIQEAKHKADIAAMGKPLMNGESMVAEDPKQPEPEVDTTPPAAAKQERIVIGDKVFDTADAALAYANGLAEAQTRAAQTLTRPIEEPTVPAQKVKLGQLLFEDPESALTQLKEQAKEEIRSEQRVVEENRKFWEDFYLRHPDLRGSELLVDAVLGREQNVGNFRGLSRTEAAPILAAKARQEVSKIRNVPSGGQALPSAPAMVAATSGASTPKLETPKPAATNFMQELRSLKKRA